MSIEGNEKTFDLGGPPNVSSKKSTRSRPVKVRTHKLTTAYKQDVAVQLDKLHAGGQTVTFILPSPDVRGFEIISYTEESLEHSGQFSIEANPVQGAQAILHRSI